MTSSVYYPVSQRPNGHRKGRTSWSLPAYSSTVQEKLARHPPPAWFITVSIPIPGIRSRRLRMPVLNPRHVLHRSVTRFGQKRGIVLVCVALVVLITIVFALGKRFGTEEKKWPTPFTGDPSTLVFKRDDLQRIWLWEIASGHYPSRQNIPEQLRLKVTPDNPAVPPRRTPASPLGAFATDARGVGPRRTYLDIQSRPPHIEYPPRPMPGSVADLDIVMEHCDFAQKKYVRDCLEVLRVGAGLDNGKRFRRGKMDDWKYIYLEQAMDNTTHVAPERLNSLPVGTTVGARDMTDDGLVKKRGAEWEASPIALPPPLKRRPHSLHTCNPENPRLFHMFWTGPFTDKPYLAILAFLFTQNTGLHIREYPDSAPCRPQFWMWINPGPAAAVPNPSATRDMFNELKHNPWAAPFLHPRFKNVIQFKLWNTTEQLDNVAELDEWRSRDLFTSGGRVMNVKAFEAQATSTEHGNGTLPLEPGPTGATKGDDDDLVNRTGSKSSTTYDRLSVILSDVARFILCHRFGGIYLDADMLILRDWEELWGWSGAFAYRWSRLAKYNTAVLRLNKGSAMGTFLLRTAFRNGLDFHPMTVSKYTKEAYMDNLLLRLPDALFDPAWLNTEYYQRERPPQPFLTDFSEFFNTPSVNSAAPQALGFEGFFRGAYAYHFHNNWWRAFDPARNWPDLGPRFINGERIARAAAKAVAVTSETPKAGVDDADDRVEDDLRDLPWSTVLKRTFEAYIRGDRPNMYGEWIQWDY